MLSFPGMERTMSKEANAAALGKFAEAVNTGNYGLFRDVVASDCVDHDPAPGQVPGPTDIALFLPICAAPSLI